MVRYVVRIGAPHRHLAEVTARFPVDGLEHVELVLPTWTLGSYLIRDYARFVRDLTATTDDGAPRAVGKRDKTTWTIDVGGARELVVRYEVYGHDLSVRTNHIDGTHALLHPPATFIYARHLRDAPVEVELDAPADWPVTCGLAWDGERTLRAADIDELHDHPILLGGVRTYPLPAKLPVKLAIHGERAPGGTYDEARLVADLGAIVDDHVARIGEPPCAHYTFVLVLSHDAYGGLEHRGSSVNLYHPHWGASRKAYEGLLELLSHELFHAWNGKRIAPAALSGPIDHVREAYTRTLWMMEGLTSHYDRYALRTAGRITGKSLLEKIVDDWSRLLATPGRTRQSLEQASFDAWIKLYRPDESNVNTSVSYYLKGGLVMVTLDLEIRRRTAGAKSLDDVLRLLWHRFGKPGTPHPEELQPIFEEATGLDLSELFDRCIRGTQDPDLPGELAHVGLALRPSLDPGTDHPKRAYLGATLHGVRVTHVLDDTAAHEAGLSPGDEVIALDRFRTTTESELRSLVSARSPGESVTLSVFRRHRLLEVPVILGPAPPSRFELVGVAEPAAAARYQAWLAEPHPGAVTVATITTTARSV
ncbi:MAG TPA: PDZ domain-containing protein [Kofleriaceae bacterium]|nr:PDZ domain-containing protein [Kofleriaceae bacterium]